ncbi:hypothetical protein [Rhodoferax antarcticus]|uniref:hypothetical protein n=1 Tax=Rhodoferax antarcticus TaxID=81479 RepID=UPI002225A898|nr:hypothetical protein [Rhodoferax antarcticus]MCW2311434.1 hypothetical protein [Rhodoferax antarcticus]
MPENLVFTGSPLIEQPLVLVFGEGVTGLSAKITDLVFAQPPRTNPTRLVLGDSDTSTHPDSLLEVSGALPELRAHLHLVIGVPMALQAALPDLVGTVDLKYQSQTQRPTVAHVQSWSQVSIVTESGLTQPQQHAQATNAGAQDQAQNAVNIGQGVSPSYVEAIRFSREVGSMFQDGCAARSRLHANWSDGLADRRVNGTSPFQEGQRAPAVRINGRFQDGLHDRRAWLKNSWTGAIPRSKGYTGHAGAARPLKMPLPSAFQEAWVPRPGVHLMPAIPPVIPTYWGTALLFACPPLSMPMLVFGARQCGSPEITPVGVVTVAVRKVYVVINDVSLRRASNGVEVPLHSLSLSLDASSWAWGFDAVLPHSAQSLIEPEGTSVVELLVSVNGTTFAVLAENISRERSFGQTSIRLTGRGKNAVLAAPYAPVMTFTNAQARTARQLMDDVLTINGVTNGPSLGWSVDWGLTDWNVPAKVFSHQGTWIEALRAIAGAAGGYLLPHPRDQTIRVRHRYPVAPWDWATETPNFVLPVDAIEKESLRWLEKPVYNRVFASGVDAGVLAQVTRSGTAGDLLAPMVVDALITEAAVARQRGLAVLSDTGRQIEVSLNLPVLADTGIIEPGSFVQYRDSGVDRIGLVRSTQVQAGFPEVWQTLGVQTYA